MQQAGEQTREGEFDVNRLNYGKNLATAELTKPVLTQTGSSGTGTVRQSENPFATVTGLAANIAPLSL